MNGIGILSLAHLVLSLWGLVMATGVCVFLMGNCDTGPFDFPCQRYVP